MADTSKTEKKIAGAAAAGAVGILWWLWPDEAAAAEPGEIDPIVIGPGVVPTPGDIDPQVVVPQTPTVPDKPGPVAPVGPTPFEPGPGEDPPLPSIIAENPTPATYYRVRFGDTFLGNDGIAARLIFNAAIRAAQTHGGLDAQAAAAWAQSIADAPENRAMVTEFITCRAPTNDFLYGTHGYQKGVAIPSKKTWRAIRLLPRHADNLERLAAGQRVMRNIQFGDPSDPGSGDSQGADASLQNLEQLWMPGLDLQRLWDTGGAEIRIGGTWADGSSKAYPPPWVLALHGDVLSADTPAPFVWGCGKYTLEMG